MAKTPPSKAKAVTVVKRVEPTEPPADSDRGNGSAKPMGVKNKQAANIRETEVLQSVAGLNLDSVSVTLASTQVEVQKSLSGLSAKLVEQLQVLRDVEGAIALKRDELKQLYDMEAAAIELDDLEARIDEQRQEWEEEQARRRREFSEQQGDRNKQWQREEEEYQYRMAQEHKKAQDAFAARMAEVEKANRERQESLEKNWTERENELKKRENELVELKQQVAAFPEQMKKEVNAAVAVATNSVKKEYETKLVLAAKDTELGQKLAAQEVASLKQALDKATAQIADLKQQIDQAHQDVKEISARALESASGRSAMEALQRVLEKEPPTKPSK
jgi:hypothetical protein